MNQQLHLHYDEEGDLLEIRIGEPTPTSMKNLGNDLFERIEEKSGFSPEFSRF